jgi:hypothetical protein
VDHIECPIETFWDCFFDIPVVELDIGREHFRRGSSIEGYVETIELSLLGDLLSGIQKPDTIHAPVSLPERGIQTEKSEQCVPCAGPYISDPLDVADRDFRMNDITECLNPKMVHQVNAVLDKAELAYCLQTGGVGILLDVPVVVEKVSSEDVICLGSHGAVVCGCFWVPGWEDRGCKRETGLGVCAHKNGLGLYCTQATLIGRRWTPRPDVI